MGHSFTSFSQPRSKSAFWIIGVHKVVDYISNFYTKNFSFRLPCSHEAFLHFVQSATLKIRKKSPKIFKKPSGKLPSPIIVNLSINFLMFFIRLLIPDSIESTSMRFEAVRWLEPKVKMQSAAESAAVHSLLILPQYLRP